MKKLMILVVGSCSLAACATLGQPAFDWTGQNFDSYVQKYGAPTSQYCASNGNMVYSFKKTCEYDPMKEGETLVTVGEGNLIQTISTPTPCPSYYDSPAYEIDQRRQEMEREREKREDKLREKRNDIAGELLNMGTEEIQQLNMMSAETKAIYAESKKKAGMKLTSEEEQLIRDAEEARQNFANWKKRHDELRAQLEALR